MGYRIPGSKAAKAQLAKDYTQFKPGTQEYADAYNRTNPLAGGFSKLKKANAQKARQALKASGALANRNRARLMGTQCTDPSKVRNPATGRCIKPANLPAKYKTCPPGKERNPATNRCRKAYTPVHYR